MNQFESFKPITRRELRINYRSPLICQLSPAESGSGSGNSIPAFIAIVAIDGPTGLSAAVSACPRVVTLTWDVIEDADGYNVYASEAAEGPFFYFTSVTNPTYSLPAAAGTGYFQVSAFGSFGLSNPSATLAVVVPPCEE
jgi:hypothetical protein